MIEPNRALQPLREAEAAIAKLQDYESTAELASALQATNAAVQRSLRYLLRADQGAPEDVRLAALSPTDMAPDRLLPALRQRDLISIELAGQIHELDQVARRAAESGARASDADLALRVVDQMRVEVQGLGDRSVREVAHDTVMDGALDEVHAVPMSGESRRPMRVIAALLAVVLLGLAIWLLLGRKSGTEQGVAEFNRGKFTQAERTLSKVVDSDPGDETAAYYLAVLYRRSRRYDESGRVLRRALQEDPADPYLHEELGNLFMELQHPDLAAKQYRTAQEQDPKQPRHWVKLVEALRAAGDPQADVVLEQAPEEARALLRTGK